MNKYARGKIYEVYTIEGNLRYYGSTIQPLMKRMHQHRKDHDKKNQITSRSIFDYDDVDIRLIEEYPCENKEQLLSREKWYIINNECVNRKIPTRTKKEWTIDNKERCRQNGIRWRKENKERCSEYKRQYYKDKLKEIKLKKVRCSCGDIVAQSSLKRHMNRKVHLNKLNKQWSILNHL